MESLPSLAQFSKAFPVLVEEIVNFLLEISPPNLGAKEETNIPELAEAIQDTFQKVVVKHTNFL
jgi:hypothetical protein